MSQVYSVTVSVIGGRFDGLCSPLGASPDNDAARASHDKVVTQLVALTQTFLCLHCGTRVDNPAAKNGFMRCAKGHRVQVLKSRPLWQIGLFSFGIAFWILAIVVHLFQTSWLTDKSRLIVWLLLTATLASSVYLAIRGARLMKTPTPIGAIGRQYIAVAVGRLVAAGVLGALAALQIFY
jgi:hypothetical protein